MGFSRQEYWSGLPCPPPGDLPDPEIAPESLTSPALAGGFFTTSATWAAPDSEAIAVIQENCKNKMVENETKDLLMKLQYFGHLM